jgi:hypothetical protein
VIQNNTRFVISTEWDFCGVRVELSWMSNNMDKALLNKIKVALNDDLHEAYDGNYNAWVEQVNDCPSNTLEDLYEKIPEDEEDEYFEEIQKMIKAEKFKKR